MPPPPPSAASSVVVSEGEKTSLKIAGSRSERPASGVASTTGVLGQPLWNTYWAKEPAAAIVVFSVQLAVVRKAVDDRFQKFGAAVVPRLATVRTSAPTPLPEPPSSDLCMA